ncbi:hypothetical protein BCU45_009245 [Vibrio lentus]|uniref:hypothetical protein n=1 Tax=Vibrio lentus TaxID=136468 RepID=UPI000C818C94|nr:hypothetical protein [Vibrio lentus]PMI43560.1 hypothetical protein BCU45_11770 [Vibrio lentus]PMI63401.1 hypothetical protein BCU40_22050 [Vibrio lentus]PMJ59796.1 hypothetical protein BCU20_00005 [Vibrio lentus]PMN03584.1 hypothetical protein BCT42_15485 [Vibrio lentus]
MKSGANFRAKNGACLPVLLAIGLVWGANFLGIYENVPGSLLAYWSTTLLIINIYFLNGYTVQKQAVDFNHGVTIAILVLAALACIGSLISLDHKYIGLSLYSNIINGVVLAADLFTVVILFRKIQGLTTQHYIFAGIWYLGFRAFLVSVTGS